MDLEVSSQFLIEVLYYLVKYVFEIDVITCSILFTNIIDALVFAEIWRYSWLLLSYNNVMDFVW